jgi:hypothetical protein
LAQEFTIKSQSIEDKINQLLPSQGGFQAGVDFSASTMVIPIVDLTESAEGSSLREDLQVAWDFATTNTNIVNASNTVLVNTTGFYKVCTNVSCSSSGTASINLFDGTTSKDIKFYSFAASSSRVYEEFIVFLSAGLSLRGTSSNASTGLNVSTRQIADVAGNLTNPNLF